MPMPSSVLIAVMFLWASLLMNAATLALGWQSSIQDITTVPCLLMQYYFITQIAKGRNIARFLLLILFFVFILGLGYLLAIDFPTVSAIYARLFAGSTAIALLVMCMQLSWVGAVVLLFTNPATAWFNYNSRRM